MPSLLLYALRMLLRKIFENTIMLKWLNLLTFQSLILFDYMHAVSLIILFEYLMLYILLLLFYTGKYILSFIKEEICLLSDLVTIEYHILVQVDHKSSLFWKLWNK